MKELESLWNLIKETSKNKMSLGEIIEYQKNIKNAYVNNYFNKLREEMGMNSYGIFDKYKKYINFISDKFKNSFEYTGGTKVRFYHSMYVAFLSNIIADKLAIDSENREIAILSAIFHDIGKSHPIYNEKTNESYKEFEAKHNIDHEKLGSEMVFEILKNDYSLATIEKISAVIYDEDLDKIYAKILHDADNMSELGRMEIYKSFYYNCLDNRTIEETIDYWFIGNSIKKLKKISTSKFDFTKKMMEDRLQIINDIYNEYVEQNK